MGKAISRGISLNVDTHVVFKIPMEKWLHPTLKFAFAVFSIFSRKARSAADRRSLVRLCLFDLFFPFTPTEIILASVVVFFGNSGKCSFPVNKKSASA